MLRSVTALLCVAVLAAHAQQDVCRALAKAECLKNDGCGFCSWQSGSGCFSGTKDAVNAVMYPTQCCDAYEHATKGVLDATGNFKKCGTSQSGTCSVRTECKGPSDTCALNTACNDMLTCMAAAGTCDLACATRCRALVTDATASRLAEDVFTCFRPCHCRKQSLLSCPTPCSVGGVCEPTSILSCGTLTQQQCTGACSWFSGTSAGTGSCRPTCSSFTDRTKCLANAALSCAFREVCDFFVAPVQSTTTGSIAATTTNPPPATTNPPPATTTIVAAPGTDSTTTKAPAVSTTKTLAPITSTGQPFDPTAPPSTTRAPLPTTMVGPVDTCRDIQCAALRDRCETDAVCNRSWTCLGACRPADAACAVTCQLQAGSVYPVLRSLMACVKSCTDAKTCSQATKDTCPAPGCFVERRCLPASDPCAGIADPASCNANQACRFMDKCYLVNHACLTANTSVCAAASGCKLTERCSATEQPQTPGNTCYERCTGQMQPCLDDAKCAGMLRCNDTCTSPAQCDECRLAASPVTSSQLSALESAMACLRDCRDSGICRMRPADDCGPSCRHHSYCAPKQDACSQRSPDTCSAEPTCELRDGRCSFGANHICAKQSSSDTCGREAACYWEAHCDPNNGGGNNGGGGGDDSEFCFGQCSDAVGPCRNNTECAAAMQCASSYGTDGDCVKDQAGCMAACRPSTLSAAVLFQRTFECLIPCFLDGTCRRTPWADCASTGICAKSEFCYPAPDLDPRCFEVFGEANCRLRPACVWSAAAMRCDIAPRHPCLQLASTDACAQNKNCTWMQVCLSTQHMGLTTVAQSTVPTTSTKATGASTSTTTIGSSTTTTIGGSSTTSTPVKTDGTSTTSTISPKTESTTSTKLNPTTTTTTIIKDSTRPTSTTTSTIKDSTRPPSTTTSTIKDSTRPPSTTTAARTTTTAAKTTTTAARTTTTAAKTTTSTPSTRSPTRSIGPTTSTSVRRSCSYIAAADKCESVEGCDWMRYCTPVSDACQRFDTADTCNKATNCRWDGTPGNEHCHAIDHACYELSTTARCEASAAQCKWVEQCEEPRASPCENECAAGVQACEANRACALALTCARNLPTCLADEAGCDKWCAPEDAAALRLFKTVYVCFKDCESNECSSIKVRESCDAQTDCHWRQTCRSERDACRAETTAQACAQNTNNCAWEDQAGFCHLTMDSCNNAADARTCADTAGCVWEQLCDVGKGNPGDDSCTERCSDREADCAADVDCQEALRCAKSFTDAAGNDCLQNPEMCTARCTASIDSFDSLSLFKDVLQCYIGCAICEPLPADQCEASGLCGLREYCWPLSPPDCRSATNPTDCNELPGCSYDLARDYCELRFHPCFDIDSSGSCTGNCEWRRECQQGQDYSECDKKCSNQLQVCKENEECAAFMVCASARSISHQCDEACVAGCIAATITTELAKVAAARLADCFIPCAAGNTCPQMLTEDRCEALDSCNWQAHCTPASDPCARARDERSCYSSGDYSPGYVSNCKWDNTPGNQHCHSIRHACYSLTDGRECAASEADCEWHARCESEPEPSPCDLACRREVEACKANPGCLKSYLAVNSATASGECDYDCIMRQAPRLGTEGAQESYQLFVAAARCYFGCEESYGGYGGYGGGNGGGNGGGSYGNEYQPVCSLRPEAGPCRALVVRYFYNMSSMTCEPFNYGGCAGNANNFATMASCEQACDIGACCMRTTEQPPSGSGSGSGSYAPQQGYGYDGYDAYGFNADGYARDGYTRRSSNQTYAPQPRPGYDSRGYSQTDGYDVRGYDADGYDRAGYSITGVSRDGQRDGQQSTYTRDGRYNAQGYDRAGLDQYGLDAEGRDYQGIYRGRDSFRCEQLSRRECAAREVSGRVRVVGYTQGARCEDVKCAHEPPTDPRSCQFAGRLYSFGQNFTFGCQRCSCQTSGRVECDCAGNVTVRREIRDLSTAEMQAYTDAVVLMHASGRWQAFRNIHLSNIPNAHGNPAFLPWHRAYLRALELELREISGDCSLAIPYWDWRIDAAAPMTSVVWAAFGGNGVGASDCVTDGPFNGFSPCVRREFTPSWPLPTVADITALLATSNYGTMVAQLEARHGDVHMFVGGDMTSFGSPWDPIFYSHHAQVDKLWFDWQTLLGNGNAMTPSILNTMLSPFGWITADVLDSEAQVCVRYAQPSTEPPCNGTSFGGAGGYWGGNDGMIAGSYGAYGPDGYNRDGYARDGYDRTGYNRYGLDRDGYDRDGFNVSGYDRRGQADGRGVYDADGYHRTTGYSRRGYDRRGYDRYGYASNGLNALGCSGGFNGPFYVRDAYTTQTQAYGNPTAYGPGNRTCGALRPLPDWFQDMHWMRRGDYGAEVDRYNSQIGQTYDRYTEGGGRPSTGNYDANDYTPTRYANEGSYCMNVSSYRPQQGACPPGVPEVRCLVNPCANATCRAFPNARCVPNYCGGCFAEFFVNNARVRCDGPACNQPTVPCYSNPCLNAGPCYGVANATCRPSTCGACRAEWVNRTGHVQTCRAYDPCICTREYQPVCGTNNRTYGNVCELNCARVPLAYPGACTRCRCTPSPYDTPVCGVDGKTYRSACELRCTNVGLDYVGRCIEPDATCESVNDLRASDAVKKALCLRDDERSCQAGGIKRRCEWLDQYGTCACPRSTSYCTSSRATCLDCCDRSLAACRAANRSQALCRLEFAKCSAGCPGLALPAEILGRVTLNFQLELAGMSEAQFDPLLFRRALAAALRVAGLDETAVRVLETDELAADGRRRRAAATTVTVELLVNESQAADATEGLQTALDNGQLQYDLALGNDNFAGVAGVQLASDVSADAPTTPAPTTTSAAPASTAAPPVIYTIVTALGQIPEGAYLTPDQEETLKQSVLDYFGLDAATLIDFDIVQTGRVLTSVRSTRVKPTAAELSSAGYNLPITFTTAAGQTQTGTVTTGSSESTSSGGGESSGSSSFPIGAIVGAAVAGVVLVVVIVIVVASRAARRRKQIRNKVSQLDSLNDFSTTDNNADYPARSFPSARQQQQQQQQQAVTSLNPMYDSAAPTDTYYSAASQAPKRGTQPLYANPSYDPSYLQVDEAAQQ